MAFMPIGVIVNSISVLLGGVLGASCAGLIPERVRSALMLIFGVASMSMGIASIVKMTYLPSVILAIILGTAIGELIYLEKFIGLVAHKVKGPLEKIFVNKNDSGNPEEFMEKFIGIVVLFCASGTGVFGALQSGITGDHTILLTKSILDLFTAAIFATTLGYMVAIIFVPQFIILMTLFFAATFILPLTTPALIGDFNACGGVLMLATGLRICGIKSFPIANMLPAMLLVMPLSYIWATYVVALLK